MRVGLPLLISAAMAATPLVVAPPATAATGAIAPQATTSMVATKKDNSFGRLRVIISGAPQGRVRVKGPSTRLSVTKSSVLRVHGGSYRVHAKNITLAGAKYVPATRNWSFTIRKGSTTMVNVNYAQAGSSSPGSVDSDVAPTGMLGEAFTLINELRSQPRQCGNKSMPAVDPVVYDAELGRAAQGHADDMNVNNYFEHDSLDGRSFADRIEATDYSGSPAGENIAMGFQSASDVVNGWMKSPGHCLNIMDVEFDEMGFGFASHVDPGYSVPVTYWVQDFGYAPDYL